MTFRQFQDYLQIFTKRFTPEQQYNIFKELDFFSHDRVDKRDVDQFVDNLTVTRVWKIFKWRYLGP